ncbi:hypothetical protein [Reichenbachiella ulvae]|uniref:Lipoprotein n=1 Tax=Reichenbachiella ulvae TaxID=2980104 RepID=A0ABT3CWI4_9BACT|nr:hypothetical protein [Reichenbachiella ulvae]MCV9388053.1 hypothetical protein [Reichenbachiella ulvae]
MKINFLITSLFLLTLILSSCIDQKEIVVKSDQKLALVDSLINLQKTGLDGKSLSKSGSINGVQETLDIQIDTSFVKSEFKVLNNKKFDYIFTNGGYTKTEEGNITTYQRKPEEYAGPLLLQLTFDDDQLTQLYLIEERDNYLYRTRNEAQFDFDKSEGLISNYQLQGLQKIIALDSTGYQIRGKVKL